MDGVVRMTAWLSRHRLVLTYIAILVVLVLLLAVRGKEIASWLVAGRHGMLWVSSVAVAITTLVALLALWHESDRKNSRFADFTQKAMPHLLIVQGVIGFLGIYATEQRYWESELSLKPLIDSAARQPKLVATINGVRVSEITEITCRSTNEVLPVTIAVWNMGSNVATDVSVEFRLISEFGEIVAGDRWERAVSDYLDRTSGEVRRDNPFVSIMERMPKAIPQFSSYQLSELSIVRTNTFASVAQTVLAVSGKDVPIGIYNVFFRLQSD